MITNFLDFNSSNSLAKLANHKDNFELKTSKEKYFFGKNLLFLEHKVYGKQLIGDSHKTSKGMADSLKKVLDYVKASDQFGTEDLTLLSHLISKPKIEENSKNIRKLIEVNKNLVKSISADLIDNNRASLAEITLSLISEKNAKNLAEIYKKSGAGDNYAKKMLSLLTPQNSDYVGRVFRSITKENVDYISGVMPLFREDNVNDLMRIVNLAGLGFKTPKKIMSLLTKDNIDCLSQLKPFLLNDNADISPMLKK